MKINYPKMYKKIINYYLFLMFLIIFIPFIKENELTKKNKPEIRNLNEETFGEATLHFGNGGAKILVNVNDVPKENLAFYLKNINGDLSKIDNYLTVMSPTNIYSAGAIFSVAKVSYTLSSGDDEIVIKLKEKPTSLKGLFAFSEASKITLENFQTKNVQTMELMFYNCQYLNELSISDLDTSSVINMGSMFKDCGSLTQLVVPNWDTGKVMDMNSMFYGCYQLNRLDAFNWNTEKVTNMSNMFNNCAQLTKLDLSSWDTSNVENMLAMFNYCQKLTQLTVSNWNTGKVTEMSKMFSNCAQLSQLDVSSWNTKSVIDMSNMFDSCQKLTKLDVSNWDTSSVINMESMFISCQELTELNVASWNTGRVTNMKNMFKNCKKLTQLNVSKWNTSSVTNMNSMFYYCAALTQIDASSWDTSKVTDMSSMFSSCIALTQLDVSNMDTSSVIEMATMFFYSSKLTKLNVSNWNVSRVKSMVNMFASCSALTQLDVSKWDISKVNYMTGMFNKCSKLTELNVSNWNTSSVTRMENMFSFCSNLIQLDVSRWNTISVTNMESMFYYCQKLIQLDASNWDTKSVTSMEYMFYYCQALTQLDVSNWKTSNVTKMNNMFEHCDNLIQLDLSDWDTSNVAEMSSMFFNCKILKDINIENFKQKQITTEENAQNFLVNADSLEYCRYSGDASDDMAKYFLNDCSKLIGFSKCGTCDSNSDDALCEKTITVAASNTKTFTKTFHYLEEEKSINKLQRSCYWIEGLETLSYFNKTLIDKYHYIQCDDSCRLCGINIKMCKICNDGFYSLFNETSLKRKRCYNELSIDKHFYLYNSTEYRECPIECTTCIQGQTEATINCLTCIEDRVLFGGNCVKREAILVKETFNYTYEDLKNNKKNELYELLSNYSNNYYNNSIFIQQFINQNITLTLYNVGTENMNNTYLDQLKLDIFKVNLGICYEKIIQKYNITEDLVFAQIDFLDNSNKINYVLYNPKTNKIINMSICEDTEISISKIIELTEELKNIINNANEQGYNIADINDPFYNDVCTPYTTSYGTDITMSDRITDIYNENFGEFANYENCEFEYFNISETNATVTCKSKAKTNFFEEIKDFSLDTNQLLDNFKFCEASNFYVVKCYKEFFSKKGQSNNYANYLYYLILAVVLILFTVYCFTGINYLDFTLAKIAINRKFRFNKNKQKSMQNQSNEGNAKKSHIISNLNVGDSPNQINQCSNKKLNLSIIINNRLNPPKKINTNMKNKLNKPITNQNKSKSKNLNSQFILVENKKNSKNIRKEIKKENNKNNVLTKIISFEQDEEDQKTKKNIEKIEEKEENNQESKIKIKTNEKKNKKNIGKMNIKNLTEVDLNELDYNEALEYDKRTFMQLYLSCIRLKHPILSLFYDNYNITAIKFILFIESFGMHVCMNGLFFREDTMHRIYIDNGSFNFIYRLPLTLYSVIISGVISSALKNLVLTQSCIIQYKKQVKKFKNKDEAVKKAVSIIKNYKIKFIIFAVAIILTLVVFWFYIGCFCTVYHNTQFYLLKDSLIGFGLSMLYPFGLLLIGGYFRFVALKKKSSFLYKVGRILA